MNKQEFVEQLRKKLYGLPQEDIDERLTFYTEIIDDRIEDGIPEETAVGGIGTVDGITSQIIADIPLTKIVKEKITPKKKMKTWEIIFLILGSPIWISIILAISAVILAIYVSIWAVIISLWSVFAAFVFSVAACIAAGLLFIITGNTLPGIAAIGAGLVCAGLSVFIFFGCKAATKGILTLTKKSAVRIKTALSRRRNRNE